MLHMLSASSVALVSLLAAGPVVELGGMKSAAPASWKESPPANSMRLKQFTVPGKAGDAEIIVFFFGQGQGGSVQGNVDRWKGMFKPPAGKTIDQVSKLDTLKGAKAKTTILDVSGTYLHKASPMGPGPAEERPDHRMLAAVMETPTGAYYIRLVGPAKTVSEQKKAYEGWLKAFK